ncbi:MAG TPA: class I SAM-dependent methyltransferase [Vicinamibacterales bacterium]|nr:class I SAM-dependent methyltransferase [Vicinamibacterales bacterium]
MIFAVMMVRNEADIIRVNLLYHLAFGIDQVLVIDNGSTDRTAAILEEFADTKRVHVFSRPGPFHQAETTTEFAREAFLRGARWVLPIDADEFWHTPGGRLRDILDDSAGALAVDVVNFVQERAQVVPSPRGILTMTRRVPEPIGTSGDAAELVESGRVSFVECRYPPKHISRGSIALRIAQGNHAVCGTDGPVKETAAIVCLHAPLRARAALDTQKVEQGRRVEEVNHYLQQAWHVRRWRRLSDEGRMDAEWAANSYLDDCLDVGGEKHPLTVDTTLAEIVAPWIEVTGARSRTALHARPETVQERAPIPELDSESRAAILNRVKDVEGWLRPAEAELLIEVTRRAVTEPHVGTVVEIGSFCGKSTIVLASAARTANKSARVHAIDPHEGKVGAEDTPAGVRTERPTFERIQHNVSAAGVSDVIEIIRRRSYEVPWRSPIDFLFIDGLHDYWSVARDFHHFEPSLSNGSYVAFHDCDDSHPGVKTFVAGLAGSGSYEEVSRAASLVVCRKVGGVADAPGDDTTGWMAMSVRLSRQDKGISFLMSELASSNRAIQEREKGIEWLQGVVRDKEATIAELENGVAWLRKEVAERDLLIRALQEAATAETDTSVEPLSSAEPPQNETAQER